jgi:signal transduction histidine kinase
VALETGTTLAAELARVVQTPGPLVKVVWPSEVSVPSEVEPLAQSVLTEALRNVAKHASASLIEVHVATDSDTFTMEVRNDGVGPGARGAGMGLRLAAFEALQHGGVVDFGAPEAGRWRVRLVVPRAEARL